jgi:hypothetical protein
VGHSPGVATAQNATLLFQFGGPLAVGAAQCGERFEKNSTRQAKIFFTVVEPTADLNLK